MNAENSSQNKETKVIAEIQNRLPDKILAGGFFQQEINAGVMGKLLIGVGAIVGFVITYLINAIISLASLKDLTGWFLALMGGLAGAVLAQAIYNTLVTTNNQRRGLLPYKLFLAVSQDKVDVFRWQMGMSKLNIKQQVASWPRAGLKVERSTSKKDLIDNSTQPTLVIHIPNVEKPLVLIQPQGSGEKQVADLLAGIVETRPAVSDMASVLLRDPKVIQFYKRTAIAWSSGRLGPFKEKPDKVKGVNVDALYKTFTTNEVFSPRDGSALQYFFKNITPLPDEFLVTVLLSTVLTNLRIVIKNGEPENYTEIMLANVASCDLSEAKQGVQRFVMKSGETKTLLKCKHYVTTLDKLIEQGVFEK